MTFSDEITNEKTTFRRTEALVNLLFNIAMTNPICLYKAIQTDPVSGKKREVNGKIHEIYYFTYKKERKPNGFSFGIITDKQTKKIKFKLREIVDGNFFAVYDFSGEESKEIFDDFEFKGELK